MRGLFIGKPIHWLIWIVIVPVLYGFGVSYVHVRNYNLFILVVGVLSLGSVLILRWTSRPGEAITREPIPEGNFQQATIDE